MLLVFLQGFSHESGRLEEPLTRIVPVLALRSGLLPGMVPSLLVTVVVWWILWLWEIPLFGPVGSGSPDSVVGFTSILIAVGAGLACLLRVLMVHAGRIADSEPALDPGY